MTLPIALSLAILTILAGSIAIMALFNNFTKDKRTRELQQRVDQLEDWIETLNEVIDNMQDY